MKRVKISKNMLATVGYAIMIEGMTSEEFHNLTQSETEELMKRYLMWMTLTEGDVIIC